VAGRRRFNSSERVALYLAADGRCANCGTELEPGWHGDHVTILHRLSNVSLMKLPTSMRPSSAERKPFTLRPFRPEFASAAYQCGWTTPNQQPRHCEFTWHASAKSGSPNF